MIPIWNSSLSDPELKNPKLIARFSLDETSRLVPIFTISKSTIKYKKTMFINWYHGKKQRHSVANQKSVNFVFIRTKIGSNEFD